MGEDDHFAGRTQPGNILWQVKKEGGGKIKRVHELVLARGARHEPARFPKAKADGSRSRRAEARGAREMVTDLLGVASLSPDPSIHPRL